ncbi:protein PSY2 isoform X2 [Prunus yedoensis var. nudiflora]|uniref:Protein PSY2 isoform X2 n=1 Tax=Prunus yedoensis var. nudiflora TaxID=2094558 RepID=A0A314XV76_PRUYE|nr:protein PSY2 isoform X2 [Prunus yedoensis var. nudiflora]
MALRINVFLLLLLFLPLLLIPLSSGLKEDGIDPIHLLHKDGIVMNSRKLWMLDATMQDYDDTGANQKHDPKRKPGNGRNP